MTAEQQQLENAIAQKHSYNESFKIESRLKALNNSPRKKVGDDGISIDLTAIEIIAESQIIYEWLIQDL